MSNEAQIAYWNGEAGRKWAQKDAMMAQMLGPIARDLLHHADPRGAKRVLDVGCGGGSETLLLADYLGHEATVLGVDVSAPLLEVAQQRLDTAPDLAVRIRFLKADAAVHPFEVGHYDLLFSRFGVMFFDAPEAAFSHLRNALCPGARLAFCCWQRLKDNPWTLVPLQAALRHLPPPEPVPPDAPGPFAFANPERVRTILEHAGFTEVDIVHHEVSMSWGSAGDSLDRSARDMLNMGPVGRLLADQDERMRQRVWESAMEAMAPYFSNGRLSLPGAVWLVTARTGF